MVKYSALVLIFTLAVFWSSAEARYNKYQDDVINSMTKWAIEEMRDLPEPYKTRLMKKLNEAKSRHWDNVGEYFVYIQRTMMELVRELQRSKRSVSDEDSYEDLSESAPWDDQYKQILESIPKTVAPAVQHMRKNKISFKDDSWE